MYGNQSYGIFARQMYMQTIMPFIITTVVCAVIVYIASSLGLMKMFEKAGEKNWKAWIPVYNTYVLVKLCWDKKWFWPALGGYAFILIFGNLRVGNPLATVFAVLIVLVLIALFVWKCFCAYFVAQKFLKGIPWVIGIIFLDWLFYLFLGFGGSEFDGEKVEPKKEEKAPEKKPVAKKPVAKKPAAKKPAVKKAEEKKPAAPKAPATKAADKPASEPKTATKKKPIDYIEPKQKINF